MYSGHKCIMLSTLKGKLSRVPTFEGINFHDLSGPKLTFGTINFRKWCVPEVLQVNFRDHTKLSRNSLVLTPFLVIFDQYFHKSYEKSISQVKNFHEWLFKCNFVSFHFLERQKNSRNRKKFYPRKFIPYSCRKIIRMVECTSSYIMSSFRVLLD